MDTISTGRDMYSLMPVFGRKDGLPRCSSETGAHLHLIPQEVKQGECPGQWINGQCRLKVPASNFLEDLVVFQCLLNVLNALVPEGETLRTRYEKPTMEGGLGTCLRGGAQYRSGVGSTHESCRFSLNPALVWSRLDLLVFASYGNWHCRASQRRQINDF